MICYRENTLTGYRIMMQFREKDKMALNDSQVAVFFAIIER